MEYFRKSPSLLTSLLQWWTNVVFPPELGAPSREGKDVAARFARGNIAIQSGSFITTEDLERQRAEVSKIVFPQ